MTYVFHYNIPDIFGEEERIELVSDEHPGLESLAQEAAEDFHRNHDGWDHHNWPVEIDLYDGDKHIGRFSIDRDVAPVFSVREIKGDAIRIELVAAYNEVAIELACQRNRALAALEVGRFYCRSYGELAEAIGDPCSTVPEDLQQIDAAIAVCKEDK
jgi:hypothetical protein